MRRKSAIFGLLLLMVLALTAQQYVQISQIIASWFFLETSTPAAGLAGYGVVSESSDDHLWHYNPNNGGVQNVPLVTRLTANAGGVTGTTCGSITGLSISVAASRNYAVHCRILYEASTTSDGLKFCMTTPASPGNLNVDAIIFSNNGAVTPTEGQITASGGAVSGAAATAATTVYVATIDGDLQNGTTAGTWQIQGASISTGTMTMMRSSICNWN